MQLYNANFVRFCEWISMRTGCAVNPVRNSVARNNRLQKNQISRKTRGNRRPATTPEFSNGVKILTVPCLGRDKVRKEKKMETRKKLAGVVFLAGMLAVSLVIYAGGSLEPSAPPGPTMKTLDEVEPRVAIHASDLPLTITEPNSYYLAENINFTDDVNNAITIEADNVTIDLMGYSLIGPGSGTNYGIYMDERSNVEIRNGTVRDFYYGIREA